MNKTTVVGAVLICVLSMGAEAPSTRLAPKLRENVPEPVKALYERRDKLKAQQIAELKQTLADLKKDLEEVERDPGAVRSGEIARQKERVKDARDALREVRSSLLPTPVAHDPKELRDGYIGWISASVKQIIDDKTVVFAYGEREIWVDEFRMTKMLKDGRNVAVKLPIFIAGNKTYGAGDAQRTILRATPFHWEDYVAKGEVIWVADEGSSGE